MNEYFIRYSSKATGSQYKLFTGPNAYEEATKEAIRLAEANEYLSVYFGKKDCHSLDEKRYYHERSGYWKGRTIDYACND